MIELNHPFRLFTKEQCDDLILRTQSQEFDQGRTYSNNENIRTNQVVWLELTDKEYDSLWELVRDYWDQVHWYERPIQISRYSAGQFYDWHNDNKPNRRRSSVRHLTLTCTLQSAPGAVFETELGIYDLAQGEAILFPSAMEHRACAPTQHERWSFTIWYMKRNANKT